jgi:hypothetical protein
MAFTLDALASELGIDPATLTAKADVVAKWNGYLTEADSKYSQATAAQKAAEEQLAAVKREQAAIDERIGSFNVTETEVIQLRANYAALEAQAKALKEQGLNINIPEAPKAPVKAEFNPDAFRQDVNASLIVGFNLNNKFQRVFGKPLPDDIDVLAREASARRIPLMDWADQKYGFAAEEKRQSELAAKKHDEEIAAAAVKKYQEEHPATAGNPDLARGVTSRHPQLVKPREAGDFKQFANLSARQKIAASVARTRAALQNQS